jgi:S-layer homology domain.
MSKKILSVLLTAAILCMTVSPHLVKAASVNTSQAYQVITALGAMKTDDGKSTTTAKEVTRARFSQMLVNISSYKDVSSQSTNITLFKDVSKKYWAANYIKIAVSEQWMTGYINGKFMPEKAITLQEAVNAVVKLLGYSDSDFTGNKNAAKITLYYSKNLDDNITKTKNQKITSTDCMNLLYNTLKATNKAGTVYGTTLGYTLDSNGDIDYLSMVNKKMEGPIIATDTWEKDIPISSGTISYYRNSILTTKNEIQKYDVLYYSKTLNAVWAYSDKVTGTVEKISTNKLKPTQITIAGNTLTLGTQNMVYAFSTMGSVKEGDIITILLGEDGSVAGYLTEEEYNTTISGTVVETGEKESSVSTTKLSVNKYVKLVNSSGRTYNFEYQDTSSKTYSLGEPVDVTYSNTKSTIDYNYQRFLEPIYGTVNQKGTAMGIYPFAADIKILDVQGSQYMSTFPSRIAGAILNSGDILYYHFNNNSEIDELILKDVTGDMDSYGILLSTSSASQGSQISNTYSCIINNTKTSYTSSSVVVSLQNGTKKFSFSASDKKTLDDLTDLLGVNITSINGRKVQTGWSSHILSESVQVYYVEYDSDKNPQYISTTLSKVSDLNKYYLTAYYDETTEQAGRVRVIIAKDK